MPYINNAHIQLLAVRLKKNKNMIKYDVVISFAGEDREIAKEIAANLVLKGINVFYDEYEKANLWGKDLYVHLTKVYKDDSKFCLMLLSDSYSKKQWTSHERKAAQARAFVENQEYILPLRLDDTEIDGILGTSGYIDVRTTEMEEIINLITEKVHQYNKDNNIKYIIVQLEDVFKKQSIGTKGQIPIKDKHCKTVCPNCRTEQTLSESTISLDNDETIYTCKNGCQPLLVIGRPGIVAWPGRGYRLGADVIRNAQDIIVKTEEMKVPMVLSAMTAALMKKKPNC
jgi:RNase P subunit RPR2